MWNTSYNHTTNEIIIPLVVEFIEGHIKSTLSRPYADNNKRISNALSENVSLLKR